jgi:hypothetical protein
MAAAQPPPHNLNLLLGAQDPGLHAALTREAGNMQPQPALNARVREDTTHAAYFNPIPPQDIGGQVYFGDQAHQVAWNPGQNIADYTAMLGTQEGKHQLITEGENILLIDDNGNRPANFPTLQAALQAYDMAGDPAPDQARSDYINDLGYTTPQLRTKYEETMIKAAIGKGKMNALRRLYTLANNIGWTNLDAIAGLITQLQGISDSIARALDVAPPGQAGNVAQLHVMLERAVNNIAGPDVNIAVANLDLLMRLIGEQLDLRNITPLTAQILNAQVNRLQGFLHANAGGQQAQQVVLGGGGRRKLKKTKRKSKTRKAKKTGKKRKGGYKFTRAANSKRSLRMKTRKLKSLTQKSPKKKNAKKHGKKHAKKYAKKHGKKHGKKSKYHKARSEKHKRGKR